MDSTTRARTFARALRPTVSTETETLLVDRAVDRLLATADVASEQSLAGMAQTLGDLAVVLRALPAATADEVSKALLAEA